MSDIIKFVPIDDKIFRSTGSKSMLFRPSSKVRIESGYKKGIEEQLPLSIESFLGDNVAVKSMRLYTGGQSVSYYDEAYRPIKVRPSMYEHIGENSAFAIETAVRDEIKKLVSDTFAETYNNNYFEEFDSPVYANDEDEDEFEVEDDAIPFEQEVVVDNEIVEDGNDVNLDFGFTIDDLPQTSISQLIPAKERFVVDDSKTVYDRERDVPIVVVERENVEDSSLVDTNAVKKEDNFNAYMAAEKSDTNHSDAYQDIIFGYPEDFFSNSATNKKAETYQDVSTDNNEQKTTTGDDDIVEALESVRYLYDVLKKEVERTEEKRCEAEREAKLVNEKYSEKIEKLRAACNKFEDMCKINLDEADNIKRKTQEREDMLRVIEGDKNYAEALGRRRAA